MCISSLYCCSYVINFLCLGSLGSTDCGATLLGAALQDFCGGKKTIEYGIKLGKE